MKHIADQGRNLHRLALKPLDSGRLSHRIASVMAPIVCHFAAAVEEMALADRRDVLWFMARDGYLPMKVYEKVCAPGSPPARYLCVSRKSVSLASSVAYGFREAFLAEWNGESNAIGSLLAPVGLDAADLETLIARYGFRSVRDQVDTKSDPRFHALIRDNLIQSVTGERSRNARTDLLEYLEASGFLIPHSAAVVDVGWAGQIQEALQLAINESGRQGPEIRGYYMALRDLGGMRRLAGVHGEGLLFDCSSPDWRGQSILSCVDTYEDVCRGLHGTVLGYAQGMPVFAADTASRRREVIDEPIIGAVQEAILEYADAWSVHRRELAVSLDETAEVALEACVSLCRFPSAEQASFFSGLGHSLDYGSALDVGSRQEGRVGLFAAIKRAKTARWKEGSVASSVFRLPLQTAICALRARSQPRAIDRPVKATGRDFHFDPASLPPSSPPAHVGMRGIDEPRSSGKLYEPGHFGEKAAYKIARIAKKERV
jgi:hypothetical protein